MRSTIVQTLLLLFIFILFGSCTEEPLIGNWRVTKVRLVDMVQKVPFTINLTNSDSLKSSMVKAFFQDSQKDGNFTDTAEFHVYIEEMYSSYLTTGLTLMKENRFNMAGNGLIVPTSVPGWHFGDSLAGTWVKNNDTLVLSTGNNDQGYYWKFKILEVTNKHLRLQRIIQGATGTSYSMTDSENEIALVRQ